MEEGYCVSVSEFLSALAWQFEWIGGVLKGKAKAKCCLTEDQEKLDKQSGVGLHGADVGIELQMR